MAKPTRSRGKRGTGRGQDKEQSPQPQEERVNPPENQGSALKKKKGKRRSPTSLVVIELDDATAEYLLKESNFYVIQKLYEMTRQAKAFLFLYTKSEVIEKLKTKFDHTVEAEVIDENLSKEERKEEIMEIIIDYADDRIIPEASVYVGSLFTKKDMLRENHFRFGRVCSNLDEFLTLADLLSTTNDEENNNNNNLIHNLNSPTKALDMEIESKRSAEVLNEFREEISIEGDAKKAPRSQSEVYISKLKHLSAKISSKLAHKFEEMKPKIFAFDLSCAQIPHLQPSENKLLSKEEREILEYRDRNFEEIIFAQLKKGSMNKDEKPFITSEISNSLDKEMALEMKDLKFEAVNDMDTQPIFKKLKGTEIQKE